MERKKKSGANPRVLYQKEFVTADEHEKITTWLGSIEPLWEMRYSKRRPPPAGEMQRPLLRPVYWLGNWQFACLDYYRPPHGTFNRCVRAEPFPEILARLVSRIEKKVHESYSARDIPLRWCLNTCLVNLYGDRWERGKWVDCARVGEHKDFEPGPVASVSLGERALFQFVSSRRLRQPGSVVLQQWLEDSSLQLFAGEQWKSRLFHRVQRVEKRQGCKFSLKLENFAVRRINFTFRYVPEEHILPFENLKNEAKEDVRPYVERLAVHSPFFKGALVGETGRTHIPVSEGTSH